MVTQGHPDQHVGRGVGASAIRPRASSATSAVTTHLPVLRQRPSGTSEYRIATSPTAKKVTCIAGMAQPPQPSRSPPRTAAAAG